MDDPTDAPLEMCRPHISKPNRRKVSKTRRIHFLLTLVSFCGCAAAPLQSSQEAPDERTREAGELVVRLEFGAEADLDLYVTDPGLETVYFGNNPARAGGVLHADRRCGDPIPRVEIVTIAAAEPGRYRIGVEFAARCRSLRGSVPYRIVAVADDLNISRTGEIDVGRFENIALEFDLPDPSAR